MRLSDRDLLQRMAEGEITIEPRPAAESFGSFSVDVRLGHRFQTFQPSASPFLDLSAISGRFSVSEQIMKTVELGDEEQFFLHPGEFALGMTLERIKLASHIVGWLDGRSSLARVGLMVHITAHAVDPGWDGHITFEFFNAGRLPLALKPGMRIGAISFEQLSSPTSKPYGEKQGAKYHGQNGPLSSRIVQDSYAEGKDA
ncbi:dCTP deaminase [Candidatus Magnetaquicoccus inordinatus]|uniref:dCTP deaminase n=1 Tax=Candidatus Magnetaquicoccus inordinatus TaxID=2496818 RepID=UPI00102CB836|nr:dCTP deaminase [Candidatus Magnetaquicoccus inordinatus]